MPCVGGAGAASHAVSEAGRPTSQGRTPEDAIFLWEVYGLAFWCTGSWLQEIGMVVCEDVMVEVEEGVC